MTRRARLAVAITLGLLAAAYVWHLETVASPEHATDIEVTLQGARALLAGAKPYADVGPGRPFPYPSGLFYPLPAVVLAVPFALLPLAAAEALFAGLSYGVLAYALTRDGAWWRLAALASLPSALTLQAVQWAAWFAAAWYIPALTALVFAKPQIGAVMTAADPARRRLAWLSAVGGAALVVAFVLQPTWVTDWLEVLRQPGHVGVRPIGHDLPDVSVASQYPMPIRWTGGVVLLLAALRWRRPEARLLALFAFAPQNGYGTELLPLLCAIPSSPRQALLVTLLSWLAGIGVILAAPAGGWGYGLSSALGTAWTLAVLWPLTAFVLARPNVGVVPGWFERTVARLRLPSALSRRNDA